MIRSAILIAVSIAFSSCTGGRFSNRQPMAGRSGVEACTLLDSLARGAFLAPPFRLGGRAVVDVRQYHLEGDFDLRVLAVADGRAVAGDVDSLSGSRHEVFSEVFDFRSSSFFGSHREDFTLALTGGMLRIIDRERGDFMEGEDAEAFIEANTGVTGDLSALVRLMLGLGVDCSRIIGLEGRGPEEAQVFSGKTALGRFECSFRGGRLHAVAWPVELEGKGVRSLKISYNWCRGRAEPERLVLWIPDLEWRIKLIVEWRGRRADEGKSAGGSALSPGTKDGTE